MAKRRHKRGRPKSGSARNLIASAIKNLQKAKSKIHISVK
jgi:hypothetical protein